MSQQQLLVLQIQDIAFGGKGVARHGGKVFFVPFTAPGDTITARTTKEKKSFAEARVVNLATPSPDRVEPPCPYFGTCGGCVYQHLNYDAQLAIKSRQVADTLRRVGKLEAVPMQPIVASPQPFGYRNRIRVHRAEGATGFFGFESRKLVDVKECLLAQPEVNEALRKLRLSRVEDGDYSLRAPGGSGPFFEQTNEGVTQALIEMLDRTLKKDQALFVDAYCGGGLFARALGGHAEKVIGIETNGAAISFAQRHAKPGQTFIHGDVADHLGDILSINPLDRTTVLLDPPAEGVTSRVTDFLLANPPAEIAYVSCNPATLARDLGLLKSAFRIESVTPLDMFPQTAEIEVFAHLVRI